MNWPGEALVIKMWESFVDNGIGGLLKPWQAKREARANIEARQLEIVALADAEREAVEIRAGRLRIDQSRYALALDVERRDGSVKTERIEPTVDPLPVFEVAVASVVGSAIRSEVNVAKAIAKAEALLLTDESDVSDSTVDADWLYRWRDYAGNVSSEELQGLWAKLLAGELKAPGAFSYRTLELVRNLSVDEAKRIERMGRFVIDDFIARDQKQLLMREGLGTSALLYLQDLGILSGVDALSLNRQLESVLDDSFTVPLLSNGRVLLLQGSDPSKKLTLGAYLLTETGKQIIRLGVFNPHEEYLRAVGDLLKRQGVSVRIGDYRLVSAGKIQYFNDIEI